MIWSLGIETRYTHILWHFGTPMETLIGCAVARKTQHYGHDSQLGRKENKYESIKEHAYKTFNFAACITVKNTQPIVHECYKRIHTLSLSPVKRTNHSNSINFSCEHFALKY